MLKNYIAAIAISALTAGYTQNATAQTVTYGAYSGNETLSQSGTTKQEDYDVAILVKDDALVGKKVKGVKVPITADVAPYLTDGKAFMTKSLALSDGANVADLETKDFTITSGWIEVDFDTPYTLTADGVYVGYSFKTSQAGLSPLVTVSGSSDQFLYMHTTKTYRKWKAKGKGLGYQLALQVLVDGVEPNGATAVLSEANGQINTPADYTFKLKNTSSSTISNVDFTYSVAGKTASVHKELATALTPHFGKTADVTFTLPGFPDPGSFNMTITVDKVNGNANTCSAPSGSDKLQLYSFLPVKRALLEEYTGTWCGWCPRGFVGLEHMNELLGYDFVGVSYHNSDAMEFVSSYNYPSSVSGFPAAWLDRTKETDAYCGDIDDGHFHIDETYAEASAGFAPAGLEALAYFTDADQNEIEVTSTSTFAVDYDDNPYQLSYILTADGLSGSGSDWDQSNYYPSYASSFPDDDIKQFTSGESTVKGLVYNFVVVGWNGPTYIPNSLPSTIVMAEPTEHKYSFDLSSTSSYVDPTIIQDKSQLDVVAILIDTRTNAVVNARKVHVYDSKDAAAAAGITNVNASKDDRVVGYYSIDGKRYAQPQKGLNIVKLANGKTFKVVKQ